ncbi:LuxR C-terminal-related transcriptional regulator [Nonomuraea sp. NPDC059194]|uniref:helix-turn-helix transcriptional regulator n=1 Tax=Nonomuraea sp. NPDC059194 TaxID=3346764 RepID=UPI0036BE669C
MQCHARTATWQELVDGRKQKAHPSPLGSRDRSGTAADEVGGGFAVRDEGRDILSVYSLSLFIFSPAHYGHVASRVQAIVLYGRNSAQVMLEHLVAGASEGRSGALVVRGDPGIGKSALLAHAGAQPGIRVLRGAGVVAEAELPFAALFMLLRPVLGEIDKLPAPQAAALRSAFGLADAGGEDPFLTGLAVLNLLSDLGPVLCLIDDAHWLDQASARTLLFAARRLHAEGVVMVFGARDGFDAAGLPELRLEGLDRASAAELLAELSPGLSSRVRDRIIAESGGNPLALIELPRAPGSLSPMPLPRRLHETYAARIADLPPDTATMLVVAAAEETGDLGVIVAAARSLGVEQGALAPAELVGLIRIEAGKLAFTHPLMRAAALRSGTFERVLGAHAALADVLLEQEDRRAWHLAAATLGQDEEVAAALERTAERSRDQSGRADALERAADLSPGREDRARRLASAALAATEAGLPDRALLLTERAVRQSDDPRALGRLASLRARVAVERGSVSGACELLVKGAESVAPFDRTAAGLMLVDAGRHAWQLSDPARVAEAARRLHELDLDPAAGLTPAVTAVTGAAVFLTRGPEHAISGMRGMVENARKILTGMHSLRVNAAFVAVLIGDFESGREISLAVTEECRAQGAIGRLPLAHVTLATCELHLGRFRDALGTAIEGIQLAADTGQPHRAGSLNGVLAWLSAVTGDEERTQELARICHQIFEASGIVHDLAWAEWSLALLDLGHGRFAEALERLEDALRGPVRMQIQAVYFAPDQIEAALRLSHPDRALAAMRRLEAWVGAAGMPWADAVLDRCHALLADDAEPFFLRAVEGHNRPWEKARTHLLFGEWLRRERRKNEARSQLRRAVELFERLGAHIWAERARAELRAAGERSGAQAQSSLLDALSPQELQIVRLAAGGMTNKEIASRLVLSAKTVSYHLYRTFPKLGIASRIELARLDLGELPDL